MFIYTETTVSGKEHRVPSTITKPRISWKMVRKAFGATRLAMHPGMRLMQEEDWAPR